MGNTFSYIVLMAWPLLSIYIFMTRKAIDATFLVIVGGWLLLPEKVNIDIQYFPSLNKISIPAITAILLTIFIKKKIPSLLPKDNVVKALVLVVILGPIFTFVDNQNPIFNGARWVRGLSVYDLSLIHI